MSSDGQCVALNAAGNRCGTSFGLSDAGFCFSHDPQRVVQWQTMQRDRSELSVRRRNEMKAALPAGMPRGRPMTLDDAVEWSSWAAYSVASGVIDVRVAREISTAVREFRASLEKRDLLTETKKLAALVKEVRDEKRGGK